MQANKFKLCTLNGLNELLIVPIKIESVGSRLISSLSHTHTLTLIEHMQTADCSVYLGECSTCVLLEWVQLFGN